MQVGIWPADNLSLFPSGYGILVSDAKVIIGYTEKWVWQLSRPLIVLSRTEQDVQVSVPKLAVPSGNQIGTTRSLFNEVGYLRSEVHFYNETVLEFKGRN
jgi:hypothetical protein